MLQLADVWALGATIFMLKYGHPPFVAGNLLTLYNKIQNDPLVFPIHVKINSGLQDLLENMLIKDPNERFTLHKVIVHPWLRYAPVISSCTTALVSPDRMSVSSASHNPRNSSKASLQSLKFSNGKTPANVHFTPPESYDLEEAAAMEVPVKAVNHEDMYKSIGVSLVGKNKKVKARRRNLSKDFHSCGMHERTLKGEGEEDEEGEEENMMLSGWGADVFELVDEADGAGSDSDDDDDEVDDKSHNAPLVSTATSTLCGKYVSASGSSTGSIMDIVGTSSPLTTFGNSADIDSSDDDVSLANSKESINKYASFQNGSVNQKQKQHQNQNPIIGEKVVESDPVVQLILSDDRKEDESENVLLRKSMGADEENLRSNRFRSQLSKKCMKDQNSRKNVLEALSSGESSSVTSPLVRAPPSVIFPSESPGHIQTSSKDSTPNKMNLWRKDKELLKSCDGDDDIDFTGELSMEEFSVLMDTLAMQPKKSMIGMINQIDAIHPLNVALQTSCLTSLIQNKNNGIGIASYSEKGLRDDQEDRCCLIPDASEIHSYKKIGTINNIGNDDEVLHKITIACLFDGHSGSVCSEYMNKNFANMLVHHEKFLDKSPEFALMDVCRHIDGKV